MDIEQQLSFLTILRSWELTEDWLVVLSKEEPSDEDQAQHLEHQCLNVQTQLIETASAKHATSFEDLLCKMPLWYRDAPDLEMADTGECRVSLLLCSILRDLTKLTGKPDILDANDRAS